MKRYRLPILLFLLLLLELGRVYYNKYYKPHLERVKQLKEKTQIIEIPPVEQPKEEVVISSPLPPPKPVEKKPPKPIVEISTIPPAGMDYVSSGEFIIGSDEGTEFEKPKRKVYLKDFFIDKYEVTNAEYKKFLDATGYKPPKDWTDNNYPAGKGNYPVTNVTYTDTENYAKWTGKRLPSEEEWEKSARGTDGRKYPWGNQWLEERANVRVGFKKSSLQAVGIYPKGVSPYGGYDLSGNVWEWTSSKFDKKYRIIRGGSFLQPPELSRTSFRDFYEADKFREDIGFRCVKDVK
ncbi:MAG TPA: hypothetical protein DHV62_07720 [Elusimicrobia bacterium]|jgi:formylglycine-generating enzyme required for sulfatase activity|nr:hypothetical protein [Elusimicrobiota bacterium]